MLTPENFTDEVYDMTYYFLKADNIFSNGWALVKLVNHFRYEVLTEMKSPRPSKCRMGNILAPLKNGTTGEEEEVFVSALRDYVEEVFDDPSSVHLYIVTHPHRNHLLPQSDADRYKTNVNELIRRAIGGSKYSRKIKVVDFTEQFDKVYGAKADRDQLFNLNDPGSHLTATVYATKFLPFIFSHL
jgi:hypothetical protein